MRIKLKKFQCLENIKRKPNSLTLLIGKRGSGKSHLLKYLACQYAASGTTTMVIGFSPTDESSDVLCSFIPKSLIYSEFDESVFENILKHQKRRIKAGKPRRNVLIVMDDMGFASKQVFKSKVMLQLFYNGRHSNINILFTLQYLVDLPSALRSNLDVIITLKENIMANRERLWRMFFGIFPTQKLFDQAMHSCTTNYGALVMVANANPLSNEISDSVFWMRAPPTIPPVRLGLPCFWQLDQQCYEDKEFNQTCVEVRGVVPEDEANSRASSRYENQFAMM